MIEKLQTSFTKNNDFMVNNNENKNFNVLEQFISQSKVINPSK